MRITVVGLGKLGLPLAAFYLARGHTVTGCDVSEQRLADIAGRSLDITAEPELREALDRAEREGRWTATSETEAAVRASDIVVIVVPVHAHATDAVDFSMLDDAVARVGRGIDSGPTILLESTVPVGTTRNRLCPALQAAGHRHGRDFWLAYSPERVSIGSVFRDLRTYPKIVGGIDEEATRRSAAFYRDTLGLDTWEVANAENAEFVKLIETTYRDVNIALANSFALAAEDLGIDVGQAIRGANSQPFSNIHSPGVGVGGNCIPVYPYLFAASAPRASGLAMMGRAVNDGMAAHCVKRLGAAFGGSLAGRTVLVLGVTYRPGVRETANSPALRLLALLEEHGARVLAADPLLSGEQLRRLGFEPVAPPDYAKADAVILQSADPAFLGLDWLEPSGCRVVLDGRNAIDPARLPSERVRYVGVGR